MRFIFVITAFLLALPLRAEEAKPLILPINETPERGPARIPTAREAEAMRQRKKRSDQGLGFFVGGDVNLGKDFVFSNANLNDAGTNYSGTSTLNSKQAVGLRAGLEWMPDNNFGFQADVAFETPRNITALNSSLNGVATAPVVNGNASMQFNMIEIAGLYRFHYLYLPAGLNYSIPFLANMDTALAKYSIKGNLGGHVGVGGAFYQGLRIEVLLSVLGMQLQASGTDSANVAYSEDFGNGYLVTGELRAHWTF